MKCMAKVFMTIILVTFLFGIVSCSEGKQKEVEIPGVPPGYFEKWEYFTVDSEVVKEKAKEFFGGREYKAIWKWDTDGDGKIDYLLIEPHPKIVKGIKGGILIGEDGEIKLIIDRNKGIYTPEYMIDDFKRGGIREGEVECIRLLYYKDKGRGDSMVFTKEERDKIRKEGDPGRELGIIWYQIMDKDLKLMIYATEKSDKKRITEGAGMIEKYYYVKENKVEYIQYSFNFISEEKIYNDSIKALSNYRLNKSKGIVFDPVNFDPENPEEVRKYIESIKKK